MPGNGEDDPQEVSTCEWCLCTRVVNRFHGEKVVRWPSGGVKRLWQTWHLCGEGCEQEVMDDGWSLEPYADYLARLENAEMERAISVERGQ